MKKVWNFLKKIASKIFPLITVSVELSVNQKSDSEQIEDARSVVADAMKLFTFASDELTKANLALTELIERKRREHEEITQTIDAAQQDLFANSKLKVRLDEFNPAR